MIKSNVILLQNEIELLIEELTKERMSHDAELLRIGQALGYSWSVTVEEIISEIKRLKNKLDPKGKGETV
jgi:hypothetical protein